MLLACALLLLAGPAQAQTKPAVADTTVYTYVEQMPVYKDGGEAGLQLFIARHMRCTEAMQEGSSRVFAQFIVDKQGRAHGATIIQGDNPPLEAELLRVVNTLEGFEPGRHWGRPVAVKRTTGFSCIKWQ